MFDIFTSKIPFIVDNISVQGFSHKRIDKECQDSSIAWKEKNYAAVIVCDGHGGDKYIRSAFGSKTACEVGKEKISEFMEAVERSNRKAEDNLTQLEYSIVTSWREKIETDYTENPVDIDPRFEALEEADKRALINNPVKAYGSTFIAAVLSANYCFVIKLGDGNALVYYDNGDIELPYELLDEDLQFNVTTSLCNSDAAVSFRHFYKEFSAGDTIIGITLTSDGVINCYRTEEAYIDFMENAFYAYGEEEKDSVKSELSGVLDMLSEKGSGDDLSLCVIRLPLSDFERENHKLIIEKQKTQRAKKEAEKAAKEAERLKMEAELERQKAEDEKLAAQKALLEAEAARKEAEKSKLEAEQAKKELENKKSSEDSAVIVVNESFINADKISDMFLDITSSAEKVIDKTIENAKKLFGDKND